MGHGLQGQCSRHLWQPIRSTNRGLAGVENLGCADVENLGGAHVRNLGGAHVRNLGGADVRRGVVARNVRNLGTAYVKNLGMSEISGGRCQKSRGGRRQKSWDCTRQKSWDRMRQKSRGCICKNLGVAHAKISRVHMQKSLEHAESGAARMSKNGPGKCGNLAGYSKRVHQGLDWQCAAAFCIERCSRLGAGRFQSRNTENADTGVGGRSACECERAVPGVVICMNFFVIL